MTFLAGAALVAACSTAGNGSAESVDGEATSQEEDVRISMQRLPCFGTCPVYSVAITGDGTVTFTGEQHVQTVGAATARIEPAAVSALVQTIEEGGFFSFDDRYTMDAAGCGAYHTDAPRAKTTVAARGRSKTIEHDFGCGGAPPALYRIEAAIDSTAGTARWIGPR